MPVKLHPCLEKVTFLNDADKRYIQKKALEYQGNKLDEATAFTRAAQDFQNDMLESLKDIYAQIGVDGAQKPAPEERDNPSENRKRGYVVRESIRYERQGELPEATGKSTSLEFSKNIDEKAKYRVIEADQLQPSHQLGKANNLHFLPEAQPKNRSDAFGEAAVKAAIDISNNLNPEKIASAPNPYSGSPVINRRGEVIQGNSRADGIKQYWKERSEDPNGYRQYLIDNADAFGLDENDIAEMKAPVLVREVNVTDARAIELGNYDVKDIESGGKRELDPKATIQKLKPEDRQALLKILAETPGESLAEKVRAGFSNVMKVLYPAAINNTQLETLINSVTGEPNATGVENINRVYMALLFEGANNPNINELFINLPHAVQRGIEKSLPSILKHGPEFRAEIQESILALSEFKRTGIENFADWAYQADMMNEGIAPAEEYSTLSTAIAGKLNSLNQTEIATMFRHYDELVSGVPGDMFNPAKSGVSPEEAAKQTFNAPKYVPGNKKKAGAKGSAKTPKPGTTTRHEKKAGKTPKAAKDVGGGVQKQGEVDQARPGDAGTGLADRGGDKAKPDDTGKTGRDTGGEVAGGKPAGNKPRLIVSKSKLKPEDSKDIDDLLGDLDDLIGGPKPSPGREPLMSMNVEKIPQEIADKAALIVEKMVSNKVYKFADIAREIHTKAGDQGLIRYFNALKTGYIQYMGFGDEADVNMMDDMKVLRGIDINDLIKSFNTEEPAVENAKEKEKAVDRALQDLKNDKADVNDYGRPQIVYANVDELHVPTDAIGDTYPILDKHQRIGVNLILARMNAGGKGFILADGVGVGKTLQILAAAKEAAKKGPVMIITQGRKLIESAFTRGAHQLGEDINKMKNIEFGTYDDLRNKKVGTGKEYEAVLYDECFTYDTLVLTEFGPRKIGDIVSKNLRLRVVSYNAQTKELELRKIVRYFANKFKGELIKIEFDNGESLTTTPNHKIWNGQSYTQAKDLGTGSNVLHMWQGIQKEGSKTKGVFLSMCGDTSYTTPQLSQTENRGRKENIFSSIWKKKSGHITQDEKEKSYVEQKSEGQDDCKNEGQEICEEGGEWSGVAVITEDVAEGARVGSRISGFNEGAGKGKVGSPDSLQNRYCKCRVENRDRSGRELAQEFNPEKTRHEEGAHLKEIRVVSVEVLKRENIERLADNPFRDQRIYNIEVEGNHNYFADGILVSNCHNLKNIESGKSQAFTQVKSKFNVFATGTPMDTAPGAAYFAKQVTSLREDQIWALLGYKLVEVKDVHTGEIEVKYQLNKGVKPEQIPQNVMKLRDDMIRQGSMVRREYPFFGKLGETVIPITNNASREQMLINEYWDGRLAEKMNEHGNVPPKVKMSIEGQRSNELSRWNEMNKLQYTYQKVKESLAKGERVVVMADGINPTVIKGLEDTQIPGFLGALAEKLEKDGIGFAKVYGSDDSRKGREVERFQKDEVQVVLATAASGSTGIDLDDQAGGKPRKMFVVTPNYSGNILQQVFGRVSRRNTKSPSDVELIYTDTPIDGKRKKINATKLAVLRSIQQGVLDEEFDMDSLPVNEDAQKAEVSIQDISSGAFIVIGPGTFPLRADLKRMGGFWNKGRGGWQFQMSQKAEVQKFLTPEEGLRSVQAQTIGGADGKTKAQVESALKKIGAVTLKKLVQHGRKLFPNIKVVWDQKGFDQAYAQFQHQNLLMSMNIAKSNALFYTRDGKPVGFNYDTDQVARERFDLSKLEKIGAGSDRIVFDMGDKVLKVAKTARGLEQNIYEGDWYLVNSGVIPEVFERGLNYVVVEKVQPYKNFSKENKPITIESKTPQSIVSAKYDTTYVKGGNTELALRRNKETGKTTVHSVTYDAQYGEEFSWSDAFDFAKKLIIKAEYDPKNPARTMLADLSRFSSDDLKRHDRELMEVLDKYELDIVNHDVLWLDFLTPKNWGIKDGKPIHLDGGTFGGLNMITTYRGKTNLSDPEFRDIYNKSRAAKKQFGDTDRYTMFQNPSGKPNGFVFKDTVYLNPSQVTADTPFHEFGHLWLEVVKNRMPALYQAGLDLITGTSYHDDARNNPAYNTKSTERQLNEALAQAIGEKGAEIYDANQRNKFLAWWKRVMAKIKEWMGIKTKIDLEKMTLEDYLNMVAKELLTPGEISTLSDLRMPETATFRLKTYKLPADAYRAIREREMVEAIKAQNPGNWQKSADSGWRALMNAAIEGFQDENRPLKEIENDIIAFKKKEAIDFVKNDKTITPEERKARLDLLTKRRSALEEAVIAAARDPYNLLDTMTGKIQYQLDQMRNKIFGKDTGEKSYGTILDYLTQETDLDKLRLKEAPNSIVVKLREEGLNLYDLGLYMYVLHAKERNEYLNKKRFEAGMAESLERPSGMTDKEADELLSEIDKSGKREVLEKYRKIMVKELVDKPLKMRLEAGLITEEQYDKLSNLFENYTPLGVEEKAFEGSPALGKVTASVWGSGIKRLGMGTDEYDYTKRINPMLSLIYNYENTVSTIERNKMLQGLADLVRKYPDKRIWAIKSPRYKVELDPDTQEVKHADLIKDEEIDKYGISFIEDGKRRVILLKDPRLHKMFTRDGKIDNKLILLFRSLASNTFKYLRLAFTGLNPDFVAPNFFRDTQDAMVNLSDFEQHGVRREVFNPKNIAKAMGAIWRYEKNGDISGEYGAAYEEMKASGGQIAWLDYAGAEEFYTKTKTDIEKGFLNEQESKLVTLGLLPVRGALRYTLLANKVMEMAIRLSTFKTLRDHGVDQERSAVASKNVTVNFNKKGSFNPVLSLAYLFLNAGIQGSARMITSLTRSAQARRMVIGAMVGSFFLREVNRALIEAMGDDDDNPLKDATQQDYKENIIFWVPGGVAKIPVSYNMRGFKAISDGLYDVLHDEATPAEAMVRIVDTFISSLVPISDSGAVPTIAQPFVELSNNMRAYNETPISPERWPGLPKKDSERFFGKPSDLAMAISGKLADLNEGRDDLLEVSPNSIDYVFDWMSGGLKNWYKTAGTVRDLSEMGPNEFDWNKVMVIHRFYADFERQDWRAQVKFYDLMNKGLTRRITQKEWDELNEHGTRAMYLGLIDPDKFIQKTIDVWTIQATTYGKEFELSEKTKK